MKRTGTKKKGDGNEDVKRTGTILLPGSEKDMKRDMKRTGTILL